MTHPCADHMEQCDHCYSCDVLGVCCQTMQPSARSRPETVFRQRAPGEELRDAILAEAGTVASLGALVRQEAASQPVAPVLLLPSMPLSLPEAAEPIPDDDSRKEAVYVHVARTA